MIRRSIFFVVACGVLVAACYFASPFIKVDAIRDMLRHEPQHSPESIIDTPALSASLRAEFIRVGLADHLPAADLDRIIASTCTVPGLAVLADHKIADLHHLENATTSTPPDTFAIQQASFRSASRFVIHCTSGVELELTPQPLRWRIRRVVLP